MTRLIRAEFLKLRTTPAWRLFLLANVLGVVVLLVVNCLSAHALLKPLDQFLTLHSHGNQHFMSPDRRARFTSQWQLGHAASTQAAIIYTSNQLLGALFACLLGIVLVTSEYFQQTATTTFLLSPKRADVIGAKMVTAVLVAALSWLITTVISVGVGVVFLHQAGHATQLAHWGIDRAILLNLVAYCLWAIMGIGVGALIRNQLVATVGATVVYLIGAAAASTVFDLINTYIIKQNWILTAQVIVPPTASTVMTAATKPFDQSPAPWVGALVLIVYGLLASGIGITVLRRRDIG